MDQHSQKIHAISQGGGVAAEAAPEQKITAFDFRKPGQTPGSHMRAIDALKQFAPAARTAYLILAGADLHAAIVGNGDPVHVFKSLADAGWKLYGDYELKIYKNSD